MRHVFHPLHFCAFAPRRIREKHPHDSLLHTISPLYAAFRIKVHHQDKMKKNMKALLISFFAIVLCYSLFLDEEKQLDPADVSDTAMQTEAYDHVQQCDTTTYYVTTLFPWS